MVLPLIRNGRWKQRVWGYKPKKHRRDGDAFS
jgi:hypothetical protein